MRVPLLIITRGLPGCGKTTWAREYIALAPDLTVRVNRDDLRVMLFNRRFGVDEEAVTALQYAAIAAAFGHGFDVVCDDTNLPDEHVQSLLRLATQCGARVQIRDLRSMPIEVCLERNRSATRQAVDAVVPESVILSMAARHGLPLPV